MGQKWPQYKGLSPTPLAIKKRGYVGLNSLRYVILVTKFTLAMRNIFSNKAQQLPTVAEHLNLYGHGYLQYV
jgi:hypothetical protein